jgi:hypothetical protein
MASDEKSVLKQGTDVGLCIVRVQVQPDNVPVQESPQLAVGVVGRQHQTLLGAVRKYPGAVLWCSYMLWWVLANNFGKTAGQSVLGIPQFRKDFGTAYEGDYVLSASWQSALYGAPQAA